MSVSCSRCAFAFRRKGNTAEIYGGYTYTNANPETPLPKSGYERLECRSGRLRE